MPPQQSTQWTIANLTESALPKSRQNDLVQLHCVEDKESERMKEECEDMDVSKSFFNARSGQVLNNITSTWSFGDLWDALAIHECIEDCSKTTSQWRTNNLTCMWFV